MTYAAAEPVTFFAVGNADSLSDGEYRFFYDIATPGRKQRTDRFKFREDACRSLVGEALVRLIVWKRMGRILDDAMITTGEYGRPSITGAPFSYNISHSGALVAGVADRNEVGVDVEKKHRVNPGLAERFFTEEENRLLKKCHDSHERYELFYLLWVHKESYIKSIGRGLSCPLNSFECIPDTNSSNIKLHVLDDKLPERFFRTIILPDKNYACAVCTMQPSVNLEMTLLSPGELVNRLMFLPDHAI